jgi:hypothetical protein
MTRGAEVMHASSRGVFGAQQIAREGGDEGDSQKDESPDSRRRHGGDRLDGGMVRHKMDAQNEEAALRLRQAALGKRLSSQPQYSKAPMSGAAPLGRGRPSKSVAAERVASPTSTAGLSERRW